MATQNPLLDDLAGLMTGAMGAARAASEEARTAMRGQAERFVADMDLAGREEVEALKDLARDALARVDALEARVADLEAAAGKAADKS
ncbi:MAG: accessory factor UbiK family protein [Pseudomonadota bacterium]